MAIICADCLLSDSLGICVKDILVTTVFSRTTMEWAKAWMEVEILISVSLQNAYWEANQNVICGRDRRLCSLY